ncbi:9885_t:CDS:2 [Diversispora eburnea]|uniref:9885_t:CDS:1 n=1 Tax=Diversispora eburnea TaxID=1213867 RepID=A0A9N9FK77_9GLOM|nr:9885_t:CDS:2 [Diversispora eburnea]
MSDVFTNKKFANIKNNKITIDEAKQILEGQTISLQKINSEIQECKSEISDLKFECENLEKENEQLEKEREHHEAQAALIVSRLSDKKLQDLCRWHRSSIQIYSKLLDITLSPNIEENSREF